MTTTLMWHADQLLTTLVAVPGSYTTRNCISLLATGPGAGWGARPGALVSIGTSGPTGSTGSRTVSKANGGFASRVAR